MSPHQTEPSPDISPFGEDVLEAFCDVVAKDAAAKNETLRSENQAMHPIREKILTTKVIHKGEELGVIILTSYFDEDETHYFYSLDAEFPHEEFRGTRLELCGLAIFSNFFSSRPHVFIAGNHIEARIDYHGLVALEGKLVNQQGSLEELQDMIDSNRISVYWSRLGMVNGRTGEPTRFPEGFLALEGSIFAIERVKVCKQLVDRIVSFQNTTHGPSQGGGLYFTDDLERLANAHLRHDGIRKASDDRKSLLHEHESLRMARDIFQSMEVSNPNVGKLFQFKLESGSVGNLMTGIRDEELAWRLEPPNETNEATVLLSSLSHFEPTVAGIPVLSAAEATHAQFIHVPDFPCGFMLKWAPFSRDVFGLEAMFAFDESCLEHIRDRHFFARLQMSLIPEDQHDTRRITAGNEPVAPIADMTVQLLFCQVRLGPIRSNLELLGVDVDALEATYRQQQQDEEQGEPATDDDEEEVEVEEGPADDDDDDDDEGSAPEEGQEEET